MTRRFATVIVGVVIATLLLAGAGTLVLSAVRARNITIHDVRDHAEQVAANIDDLLQTDASPDTAEGRAQLAARLKLLRVMRSALSIDDLVVLVSDRQGNLTGDDLPAVLTLADIQADELAPGITVTGSRSRTAYAAVGVRGAYGRLWVVVATQRIESGLGAGVLMFLWASGITILLGFAAAWFLGRRLSRPLRDATVTTQAIAAGDLTARLTPPPAHRHDELAELTHNINDMASSLQRARTLEQQFLLSVSHDLRTPLTSIRGYAEAIEDGAGDPRRAAGVIRSEARRLERLVADLLDLAKLQSQSFRFDMRRLDLAAAVRTATDGAAGSWPDVEFHAVSTAAVPVTADPDRLGQVLANLVENAGKYARSKVLVSARADNGWAIVTVDDDGPGIPAHDLPHVFERLYVARHAPERKENASGLGLAIVAELVAAMGGDVTATAAPGGGARLSFRLPLA
jgi:two-component system sensor histidine kinase BaeS